MRSTKRQFNKKTSLLGLIAMKLLKHWSSVLLHAFSLSILSSLTHLVFLHPPQSLFYHFTVFRIHPLITPIQKQQRSSIPSAYPFPPLPGLDSLVFRFLQQCLIFSPFRFTYLFLRNSLSLFFSLNYIYWVESALQKKKKTACRNWARWLGHWTIIYVGGGKLFTVLFFVLD